MTRMHFFEAMEREINFKNEYIKLEEMCEKVCSDGFYYRVSINHWIESNFWNWDNRSNYASYMELRENLGFTLKQKKGRFVTDNIEIDINKYLLYCEMLLNVVTGLSRYREPLLDDVINALIDTIKSTLELIGMEMRNVDNELIIVEKNAVAVEVADTFPIVADPIIEYNHYLLRGDLKRKKELLIAIADSLEPKRKELNTINKRVTDDFFYMVNKMNVRHNNSDPSDEKNYNSKFAMLNNSEKEEWYDLIYEQGLTLYVLLAQKSRTEKIKVFKNEQS